MLSLSAIPTFQELPFYQVTFHHGTTSRSLSNEPERRRSNAIQIWVTIRLVCFGWPLLALVAFAI